MTCRPDPVCRETRALLDLIDECSRRELSRRFLLGAAVGFALGAVAGVLL